MTAKKTPKRERLYDIITTRGLPRPNNPLDDLMHEEAMDLASEARRLRLEEIIENRKRKLQRVKQGSPILGDDSNQLLNLVGMMNQQLTTGINIASQGGKSEQISALEYIKLFKELVLDREKGKGNPSFFDDYVKARELGIVTQGRTGDDNAFSVDLEKVRTERMLESKRIDLELLKHKLERESSDHKLAAFLQMVSPLAALAGDKVASDMFRQGKAFANPRSRGNPTPTGGPTCEVMVQCPCGFAKSMLLSDPPPSRIECPNCRAQLDIAPGPPPDSDTASVWKNAPERGDFR